jgi:glycyl-tRNA synthetase alpha subunit
MSNVQVSMKMSPKATGALYMKSLKQAEQIAELEKDLAFLQSCVNSGENATKADRPSNQAKALKVGE